MNNGSRNARQPITQPLSPHDFELIPFDNLSLSSYGSHKNRTFNVGSHKGSLHSYNPNNSDHLANGGVVLNSALKGHGQGHGGQGHGVTSKHVFIDEDNVSARSISSDHFDDRDEDDDRDEGIGGEDEDEEDGPEARARREAEILEATTQELMMQVRVKVAI